MRSLVEVAVVTCDLARSRGSAAACHVVGFARRQNVGGGHGARVPVVAPVALIQCRVVFQVVLGMQALEAAEEALKAGTLPVQYRQYECLQRRRVRRLSFRRTP